ncbi:MAG: PilZ domain-containing protein [Gammaproteobacteria bacterium]|nr:PilZ domain-containing protein [Gammaproteobacteria bacterium]
MSKQKDPNRRSDNRLDICLKVLVTYTDGNQYSLCTQNMSTTGLFLEVGDGDMPFPKLGSTITVQVSSELGMPDAPEVKATVVRITDEGFGIMFLQE